MMFCTSSFIALSAPLSQFKKTKALDMITYAPLGPILVENCDPYHVGIAN
jgi:hypothetical protein